MIVKKDTCVGCGRCVPYCVMGAIRIEDHKAVVDQDLCVECSSCIKANACATDSLFMPELAWPRILRHQYSDPNAEHPKTQMGGRGTYEIKTNDVTGRIRCGMIGLVIEMGRPGLGTTFREAEKMTKALAPLGVEFETANPLSSLFDSKTGVFRHDVLEERVLSCIIEINMPVEILEKVMRTVLRVADEIDTVFSLGFLSTYAPDGSLPGLDIIRSLGIVPRPNGKFNLGMGRPLFSEQMN